MNTEMLMTVLRDEGTTVIPAGQFATFADITTKSTMPARVRKLPVLTAQFNTPLNPSSFPDDVYVGWGSIETKDMPILTVRFQCRDLMTYWLANPADEEIWRAFDRWNSDKTMVVAPVFDGQAHIVSRDFELVPQAQVLRSSWTKQGQEANELFLRSAGGLILSGELADRASSDIGTVPELAQVMGCIIATKSCAPNWSAEH